MNTVLHNSLPSPRPGRRHDLDWLRVLAILLLHLFHTGMIFVSWGWHIKGEHLPVLELPMAFMGRWRMPLLFLISGVGTTFALGFRSPLSYIKERHKRLLIPVIMGMFLIVPPQIYYERLFRGQSFASYGDFYGTVLQLVPYPQGNFSWHHLWFVVYLLVYSMLALPLFLWLRKGRGAAALTRFRTFLGKGFWIYALAAPLALLEVWLRKDWPTTHNLVRDWANFAFHFLLFVYGFLLGTSPAMWQAIERLRGVSLSIGIAVLLVLAPDDGFVYPVEVGLHSLLTWFWVLAIMGYAKHHLQFRNRFLEYANEGIYPFYILHQTAIVAIGFYVIRWPLGPWTQFVVVCLASFAASVLVYEVFVRRFNLMRVLFGMKPRTRASRQRTAAESVSQTGQEATWQGAAEA